MTITKIISSGVFGPESASLDVAIKIGFQYGGFAPKAPVIDGAQAVNRFELTEQSIESPLDCVKANMDISDGTLLFTRGGPEGYAKPVSEPPVVIPLGDLSYAGQSRQTTAEFEAIAKLPNITLPTGIQINPPEEYVKARVEGRFDIEGFFDFWQEKIFWTQIDSG